MLARITIKLQTDAELSIHMSSLFQGVLMELLPKDYAGALHCNKINPYTSHIEKRRDNWYWIITTLDEEAYDIIIDNTLKKTKEIHLKHINLTIQLTQRTIEMADEEELMNEAMQNLQKVYNIELITPMAFKKDKKCIVVPYMKNIFGSIIKKVEYFNGLEHGQEMREQLVESLDIIEYNIRTQSFRMESVKLKGATGNIKIKVNGNKSFKTLAGFLLMYGQYCGVGIKNSIGMGAIYIS